MESGSAGGAPARRILLTGGGTAGHVNPLLAVLQRLEARDSRLQVLWLGSERIESQLVPAAGLPFQRIDIRFSYRWPTPGNWGYYREHLLPLLLGKPFAQARAALEGFRPDLVLASGGYVAAPAVWAAQQLSLRTALLQLDDPPGLVNFHFADRAWRVLCSTAQVAGKFAGRCSPDKLRVTGIPALRPRRHAEDLRREYGIDAGRRLLVVMGGSLGTAAVHRTLLDFLRLTREQACPSWLRLAVLHVAGERSGLLEQELERHGELAGPVQYLRHDYVDDPAGLLQAADFYFGRCGAATTGELLATGIPSLLMPDPQHADRQQYGNAQQLVRSGQGTVLEQRRVPQGSALAAWLKASWDSARFPPPSPPAAELAAEAVWEAWE